MMGQNYTPTQKPEALIYRVIVSSSDPNAIVLDPFSEVEPRLQFKKLGDVG